MIPNSLPRCEHDCVIVNPLSAPKSSICECCYVDLKSKGPQWSPPTVDFFSSRIVSKRRRRKKDKAWSGTPSVLTPAVRAAKSVTPKNRPAVVRPTGQIILVPPTPRAIPYNTVTKWGKLVSDIDWQARTVGRELDAALDAKTTLTSLDKDFTCDESPELNSDGDDIAPFEPTESVTMNRPGVDEQVEEVVLGKKLPHGIRTPARSYFERVTTEHHSPEMLALLPDNFSNESLGIRNKVDALAMFSIAQAIMEFDLLYEERNDQRIVDFVHSHARDYTAPSAGSFTSGAITRAVRMRLRNVTLHHVRQLRERLEERRVA
jgi:hypothetical protein